MGKAKKPIPRRQRRDCNVGDANEAGRVLTRTLSPSEAAEIEAEWGRHKKARSLLDRAIAIQMGLIPPPWADESKPTTSATKPESEPNKLGWQERLVKPILREFWPSDGKPPADLSNQVIVKQVGDAYQKRHRRSVARNTILRAAGRLLRQ
ncbi:hypothetical protein IVB18_31925 [Bradyrhizobium sp. 186]|uniref:hypothetical protein n=1 Tax=Bradyrhizobium sp. 186 TaxID=2782654 RepID=UPI0020005CBE|nr:hypothetical protein [Bradyrhizobium sp. 186]UPK32837.1 hypothetical protein IVB18_31925 [Bradyrhizobium sp. 186]